MGGRDQAGTEISRMWRHRHFRLIGGNEYVARDGNPADLGDARLDIVYRFAFDQPRKIRGRENVFADRDRHTAGADLLRGTKILRRPDRLLDPFETEFAQW